MIGRTISAASMIFRVIAIAIGGYALTAGVVALSGIGLNAVGVPLNDAMLATVLSGFIFYIAVVMWGFRDRRTLIRPIAVLAAAALTMTAASYLSPWVLAS